MLRIINFYVRYLLMICLLAGILSCSESRATESNPQTDGRFALERVSVDDREGLDGFTRVTDLSEMVLSFTAPLNEATIRENIEFGTEQGRKIDAEILYDGGIQVRIKVLGEVKSYSAYRLKVGLGLESADGRKIFTGKVIRITTGLLSFDKFPQITDQELLTKVQSATFNYFWEGAEPNSGMARERTTSGTVVTTGGTGFGVMAMCVAAQRGFVTREQACERVMKIAGFLKDKAVSYHGAFPHWIYGDTGLTKPFSEHDNGADLVETALLFQGLLTARAYFDRDSAGERKLREVITSLWEAVEWSFFTKEGRENVLYWHWSPDKAWTMNMKISGWNEALIVYVLAASSPTHPISREVYDEGWARFGAMKNGQKYYDTTLPLGEELGGPLFFAHYSFLGLDPRRISDSYADYWEQVCAHARINYGYCVANPREYEGYGPDCWGLTASDIKDGYTASSPTNDRGTIAPTAALSSLPYTPRESMRALRFFYYKLGDRLWTRYGFVDAFNLTENWFDTDQHIAIDQGPIVVMIENHRTALPWNTFMKDGDVQRGLKRLGFTIKDVN